MDKTKSCFFSLACLVIDFEHFLISETENKQQQTCRNMSKLDADNMGTAENLTTYK
jgi:hypothetical protein